MTDHHMASRPMRVALLAVLLTAYCLTLYLFFRPVRMRIWNNFHAPDVFTMSALILPFMIVRWLTHLRCAVTRYAWGISAVMALDLLFLAAGAFGPLGTGHPSLESVGSYFMALAKPVLVPAALALLGTACLEGEQWVVVSTGFLCLAGETLYATYPLEWWSAG